MQNVDSGLGMSPEISRMAVIDKVAAEIIQRITRLDNLSAAPSPAPDGRTNVMSTEIRNNQFVFNTLDIHNIKSSRTLSIEDSIFFIKRDPPE